MNTLQLISQRTLALGLTMTLITVMLFAAQPKNPSIPIANAEYATGYPPKTPTYQDAANYLSNWITTAVDDGTMATLESTLLNNADAFVNQAIDLTKVYAVAKGQGLTVPKTALQTGVNNLSKSQRQDFINSVQQIGLEAVLEGYVQNLESLAKVWGLGEVHPLEGGGGSCQGWMDFGGALMAAGGIVTVFGQAEAGAVLLGVGGVFYLYGYLTC